MASSGANQHQCVAPRDPALAYVGSWQTGAICACGSMLQPTSRQFHQSPQYNPAGNHHEVSSGGVYDPMAEYLRNGSDRPLARTNGLSKALEKNPSTH
ncbi:hypothetical protein F4802DRAFT_592196 [Xylaria palmicola]|nr:hypothetical protein F4802DRAFT_592196 [Xylaria palmicola]